MKKLFPHSAPDGNGDEYDLVEAEQAKALLREMELYEELDLEWELSERLDFNPEAPAVFARLLGDMDIRDPAPLTEILLTFCDAGCFSRR